MARRLTPAEQRELGAAVLSRLESEMRAAWQSYRYCRNRRGERGMWGELAREHRSLFRTLNGIRQKARADVEFDRAIPPRLWREVAESRWTESELRMAAGDR